MSSPLPSPHALSASPPAGEIQDTLLGQIVNGKYKLLSVLAVGGMGTIYRAEQLPLERQVAFKMLHTRYAEASKQEAFHKRFLREASILAKLQHPNIVTVFDYGQLDDPREAGRCFMAMEFLYGETLASRIARKGYLLPTETVALIRQVGRGLREAHRYGVVHRDLKPSNLILSKSGEEEELLKIIDFGIVKLIAEASTEPELTQEGAFLGSPSYMAPEQISNGAIDGRTDLYSLGVILYQCLTGKLPFDGETSIQIVMAHLNQPVPPLRERRPDVEVPDWLEALTLQCLSKDPNARPASTEEFLRLLHEHADRGMYVTGSWSTGELPLQETLPSPSTAAWKKVLLLGGSLFALAGGIVLPKLFQQAVPPLPSPPVNPLIQPDLFRWEITSKPAGALVLEDGRILGKTPLHLDLDNKSVGSRPKQIVLQKEGYFSYPLTQGPSLSDVHIFATLKEEPVGIESRPSKPTSPPPPARKPKQTAPLGIRLER